MKVKNRVRILIYFLLVLSVYAAIYCVNSYSGGYWDRPVIGLWRYEGSIGIPTLFMWQPLFGYRDYRESSFLGTIFAPCIALDRAYVHRTLDLADTNDEHVIFSMEPKWHPIETSKDLAEPDRVKHKKHKKPAPSNIINTNI